MDLLLRCKYNLLLRCKYNNKKNNIKIKELLKNNKINDDMIGFQDDKGYSALIWACYHENTEIVKLLLNTGNAHPEYQTKEGNSALILVCKHNKGIYSHSVVKLLLATGNAHPEYQNNWGDSALIWACYHENTEIVKLLLNTGNAHPEYQTKLGNSALIWACFDNKIVIVKLLLATGNAHPEYQNMDGNSALIYACKNNNTEIVKLLLATGNAHPEYRDYQNHLAIYYANASIRKYIKLYKFICVVEKLKLILKVVGVFKNYDKGKPYSCEMFYLMGLDGIFPDENIDIKDNIKNKINLLQLKFMKLGCEEFIK